MKSEDCFIYQCKHENFSNEEIIEFANELFNDCVFSLADLKYIYNKLNVMWNEEYDYKPLYMLRNNKDYVTEYDFDYQKPIIAKKYSFDKKYFNYLADKAQGSKKYMNKFLGYVEKLKETPLKYYALEFVKLKSIEFENDNDYYLVTDSMTDYTFNGRKIKNLRDLWGFAVSNPLNKDSSKIKEFCEKFMNDKMGMYLKEESSYKKVQIEKLFIYYMEQTLVNLDVKVANSIKVNFLIYNKKWLDKNEYDINKTTIKKILKNYVDSLLNSKILNIEKFYKENKEIVNELCNGYLPLFDLITKGVMEDE